MINSQGEELGGINPAIKRHFELEIKTLQNADRLEQLLGLKERQKEEAMHTLKTQKSQLQKRD